MIYAYILSSSTEVLFSREQGLNHLLECSVRGGAAKGEGATEGLGARSHCQFREKDAM